ncbi:uncharacterized protein LOC126910464 [Daktulosphaira vitifoliae]|uniref:uncharacterized protein LOC126910464 n=1 Tax=Daktulosphaira vitifoliae TaxID=58002 RepID=UPI0021AAA53A|nr:uncharacterized protein LOC126910464 [Daktulosphaira vitifoliae]
MASTSNLKSTRTSATVWLIGKPTETFSFARLPSKEDVLRFFHFHHLEKKQTFKKSIRSTAESVLEVWEKARIPTQRIDSVERKLSKLVDEYYLLKKNRKTNLDSCRMKELVFKGDLVDIFDIAVKDALKIMKNEEDKTFLIMQREDRMSCSMAGVDKLQEKKEFRKRKREVEAETRRQHNQEKTLMSLEIASDSEIMDSCKSSSNCSSGDEFQVPSTSTNIKKPTNIKSVFTEDVVASIDRVNLSDRNAMFVVGSIAQALGTPIADISLSRSTIRRKRNQIRKTVVETDKTTSSFEHPLVLHWDGKLLPDIVGGTQKVDRVAVLVTGGGLEKLLAVPKIDRGTGKEQADACLNVLEEWKLKAYVRGLCFDTTSSNTGLNLGACSLIEKAIASDKELVWIACRHHIFEVLLSTVFKEVFGPSGGPHVNLFKRFQKQWLGIDKQNFKVGDENLFNHDNLLQLRQDMRSYYIDAIETQQPRDDYLEIINLCRIFLGKSEESKVGFRTPGAFHQARWMAKAIYCLKIYMFQDQFELTAAEKKGVTEISLFVSLLYCRC